MPLCSRSSFMARSIASRTGTSHGIGPGRRVARPASGSCRRRSRSRSRTACCLPSSYSSRWRSHSSSNSSACPAIGADMPPSSHDPRLQARSAHDGSTILVVEPIDQVERLARGRHAHADRVEDHAPLAILGIACRPSPVQPPRLQSAAADRRGAGAGRPGAARSGRLPSGGTDLGCVRSPSSPVHVSMPARRSLLVRGVQGGP